MEPRYLHDCTRCRSLGRFVYEGPLSDGTTRHCVDDLYFCPGDALGVFCPGDALGVTLLARHSNEGPDYSSCPVSLIERDESFMRLQPSTHSSALLEALDRYRKAIKS